MRRRQSGRAFYAGLLEALVQVMGAAKGYLVDHGPRVALLSTQLGERLGLPERDRSALFFAAILSDTGMIGLAEDAWENPVPELPPSARARVEQHPARSEDRIRAIPHLEALAGLVRHHHEWWDGSGYPDGLRGDAIPLGARILRLADTVAALGQRRPHRPPLDPDAILEVVRRSAGVEFGPEVARTYLALAEAGEIPEYDPAVFRHSIERAAEELLPRAVSPLSGEQLLAIVANLIDAKDPYTAGHSRRVATLAVAVAALLGLEEELGETVWAGGYLHDLGKLRVPLRILTKEGRLSDVELRAVRHHPNCGADILGTIPSLGHLTAGVRYHHERWDGTGYPEGLVGEHIPMVARILAVADAYDAMTSRRAYRDSMSHAEAMAEVRASSGRHFGPRVAEVFLSLDEGLFASLAGPDGRPEGLGQLRDPFPPSGRGRIGRRRAGS